MVSEEVRRDRMFGLWKRYGPFVIGAIVVFVVGAAVYIGCVFYRYLMVFDVTDVTHQNARRFAGSFVRADDIPGFALDHCRHAAVAMVGRSHSG